jgi:hypothetical protein
MIKPIPTKVSKLIGYAVESKTGCHHSGYNKAAEGYTFWSHEYYDDE